MLDTVREVSAADLAADLAREAAERMLGAIALGAWDDVADAADAAYLLVGRLAVLARAEASA